MNRILFSNKGCTLKRGIPNLMPPDKNKVIDISFFSEPGLSLRIDPKLISKCYFVCDFFVVNNHEVEEVYYTETRSYLKYNPLIAGTYSSGNLQIRQYYSDFKNLTHEQRTFKLDIINEAMQLLNQGLQEFEEYFPQIVAPAAAQL
jgi:hypothetical protein